MLGASWIAGVAAVWLLHIGQFGSCDVRGTGGRACWRLVAGWPGQRLAAGGGSASSGSLTQAEKTESPGQPLGLGWGHGSRRKAAATTARGYAKRTVATRLLAGLRAKPPGIAAGSGLVLYFLRGRHYACAVGRVPCHQGARGVPGAFVHVSRARNSPRHSSSCRLTTLVVEIESMCIRGDVRGKGIGYPISAG